MIMKKFVVKEWDDRGTMKVKISFIKENEGMKEAIIPKEKLGEFITNNEWF